MLTEVDLRRMMEERDILLGLRKRERHKYIKKPKKKKSQSPKKRFKKVISPRIATKVIKLSTLSDEGRESNFSYESHSLSLVNEEMKIILEPKLENPSYDPIDIGCDECELNFSSWRKLKLHNFIKHDEKL